MAAIEHLITPLLISVQDFAFRGQPVSLLGKPAGRKAEAARRRSLTSLTYATLPAGVFVLHSNQQLNKLIPETDKTIYLDIDCLLSFFNY
jgi:hypothetical protein